MKRLEFILLSLLAACSPVTEKIESNIVVPRIQYTGEQIMQVIVRLSLLGKVNAYT